MAGEEELARGAFGTAQRFLRRYRDVPTRNSRDDLAQESAFAALRYPSAVREGPPFFALMRTISFRMRCRLIRRSLRGEELIGDCGGVVQPPEVEPHLRVGGQCVARSLLLRDLGELLPRLSPLNRELVRAFYEGASCAALAARHGISQDAVKVRLHRSRRRLQRDIEARVRIAALLE